MLTQSYSSLSQWLQFRTAGACPVIYIERQHNKDVEIRRLHETWCTTVLGVDDMGYLMYQGVPFQHPAFIAALARVHGSINHQTRLANAIPRVTLDQLAFCSFKVSITCNCMHGCAFTVSKYSSILHPDPMPIFPTSQIRNRLKNPFSNGDMGTSHWARIKEERAALDKLGTAFGWEKITQVQIWGKNT